MEISKATLTQHERLVILAEECAEVQQVICKALRHGLDSDNNGKNPETNRQMIERELGDLMHSAQRCFNSGDLSESIVEERRRLPETKAPYLHYQDGEPAPEVDVVFGRPECIYNYCPHPKQCYGACAFPGEL